MEAVALVVLWLIIDHKLHAAQRAYARQEREQRRAARAARRVDQELRWDE